MFSEVRKRAKKAGQPPGTLIYTGRKSDKKTVITVVTYDANASQEKVGHCFEDCHAMFTDSIKGNMWVNVEGLNDIKLIEQLAQHFKLHPLTVEDILNVQQRPKVEEFKNYIFITLKVIYLRSKTAKITSKQLSIILGKNFVLSFQEHDTTLFDSIRDRLHGNVPHHFLREQGCDYLVYRLIDAVIDEYFVILEKVGDQIETLEERIISKPTQQNSRNIYRLKRRLLLLRKSIWPMREAINHLMHADESFITNFTRVYLRDVYDHAIQAIDSLETFRDMLSGMLDMYLSSITNHMNEIMKTLTIIATIFIPITAIASIYGMNFPDMFMLHWRYGYEIVLGLMVLMAVVLVLFFRKEKWI